MNNLFQVLQSINNPQHLINTLMGNSQVMSNPMMRSAIDMAQKGDSQGLEQLARNIAQTKGVNVDEMLQQVKTQFKF